jgi:hypothetical protein
MYDIVFADNGIASDSWEKLKLDWPTAIRVAYDGTLFDLIEKAQRSCLTSMVWIVKDWYDTEQFAQLSSNNWSSQSNHYFSNTTLPYSDVLNVNNVALLNGVYFLQTSYKLTDTELANNRFDKILIVSWDSVAQQYSTASLSSMALSTQVCKISDIFFVSYNEPTADDNWNRVLARFPTARRIDGIKGIDRAHRRCAELAESDMFWTIDADTILDDDWNFDFIPPDYDRKYLHIWHSRNPVNGLEYGWGAVKLWPTAAVLQFDGNWLDFTTTVGNIKMVPQTIATSAFNSDAYSAWRSGFRETVKLCYNAVTSEQGESLDRLLTWLTVANDVAYANDTVQGASSGLEYFLECSKTPSATGIKNINDFEWLIDRFSKRHRVKLVSDRDTLLSMLGKN